MILNSLCYEMMWKFRNYRKNNFSQDKRFEIYRNEKQRLKEKKCPLSKTKAFYLLLKNDSIIIVLLQLMKCLCFSCEI